MARFMRFVPHLALAAMILHFLLLFPDTAVNYPTPGGRGAVEQISALARDQDGLILTPKSTWALGCYGPWPVTLLGAEDSTSGYIVHVHRPRTLVERESMVEPNCPPESALDAQLNAFLESGPPRIFYFSIRSWSQPEERLTQPIESHGYLRHQLSTRDDGLIWVFEPDGRH
jgi:hypothetical protein